MKAHVQNRRIGELCGWDFLAYSENKAKTPFGFEPGHKPPTNEPNITFKHFPDYARDLNAMHEAEKTLIKLGLPVWWKYTTALGKITPDRLKAGSIVHATAAQRAKAFLEVYPLFWKE